MLPGGCCGPRPGSRCVFVLSFLLFSVSLCLVVFSLSLYMYNHIGVYVCIYIYIHTYVCIYIYIYGNNFVYVFLMIFNKIIQARKNEAREQMLFLVYSCMYFLSFLCMFCLFCSYLLFVYILLVRFIL